MKMMLQILKTQPRSQSSRRTPKKEKLKKGHFHLRKSKASEAKEKQRLQIKVS